MYVGTLLVEISEGWYDRLWIRALSTEQLPHTELLKRIPLGAHIYMYA